MIKIKIDWPFFWLCALSVFAVLPFFDTGFFPMHDNTQVARVYEMGKSLSQGLFPVRWVEDLGYGFGYPIFNFYSPLPYYLGGVINLIGFNALDAAKIMFVVGILLSSVTMYYFAKKILGSLPALVASLIYLYFPYHAVNIYVRGAVGELFAYAFLPGVFLCAYLLFEYHSSEKKISAIKTLLLSFFVFLVIISHNLTAFMMFLLLFAFSCLSFFFVKQKKAFALSIFYGCFVGILLSSFYLIPAVFEAKYTNVSSQVGGGADFRDHFVCLSQYWSSQWGFGGSTKGCLDGLSFKLGKQNIILLLFSFALFSFLLIKKRSKFTKLAMLNYFLLAVCLFLTLSLSKFVWQTIPFMEYLQYPWRFINFISLFTSFAAAVFVFQLNKFFNPKLKIISVFSVLALVCFLSIKLFQPQYKIYNSASDYTNKGRLQFEVSKISDEYMPQDFIKPKDALSLPEKMLSINKGRVYSIAVSAGQVRGSFETAAPAVVHANIAYFPAWKAYVDGKQTKIVKSNRGIDIYLPSGRGNVLLKFVQTPIEITGNLISAATFFLLFVGIILRPRSLIDSLKEYRGTKGL